MPARKKSEKTKKSTKAKGAKKAKGGAKKTKGRAKKAKRAKKGRRRSRRGREKKGLNAVAIGDAVRFPANARNQIGRYDPAIARGARGAEAIKGIVCSIRNVATGRLVAKTRGDLGGHVLEIMHDQTFQLHYASDRNTGGPRGPESVKDNPAWQRVREVLGEMATSGKLVSAASGGLGEEPVRSLLDGWRVVKVKAEYVESAE